MSKLIINDNLTEIEPDKVEPGQLRMSERGTLVLVIKSHQSKYNVVFLNSDSCSTFSCWDEFDGPDGISSIFPHIIENSKITIDLNSIDVEGESNE